MHPVIHHPGVIMRWKTIIIAKARNLPPFPSTVSRLAEILDDPQKGAKDVEDILSLDPAITVDILKLANAGLFSRGKEVTSVRQAVSMLGIKRIFELVVTRAFSEKVPRQLAGYDMSAAVFWRHCIAVGVFSELLADHIIGVSSDRGLFFTAGLIHDIGKLVVANFIERESQRFMEEMRDGSDLISSENSILEVDHAEIGQLICERWKLPKELQVAAGYHHRPLNAPEYISIASAVHLADILAHSWGFGSDAAEMNRTFEPDVLKIIGISNKEIELVGTQALDRIKELERIIVPGRN